MRVPAGAADCHLAAASAGRRHMQPAQRGAAPERAMGISLLRGGCGARTVRALPSVLFG
eukprot:gene34590-43549_t